MSAILHPIVFTAGERMINGVVEGTLMTALVSLLLWLAPKGNSRTRFFVWFLTLIAIAALPLAVWQGSGTSRSVALMPHVILPGVWAIYALVAWTTISFLGLARIARGLWGLHSLRQRCRELQMAELPSQAWQGLGDLASTRRIRFCVSDEVKAPTAIGFFRPAVLLPRWTLEDLSANELNRVLLHEVGHLQRWDDWTNLLQKILRALLFFHPAVWWIDSRLSLERESACDDLVLAQAPDAKAYAECLISVAEKSSLRRGIALAVSAVGRLRQTAVRLARILEANRPGGTGLSKLALGSTGLLGLVVVLAFQRVPNLVQFQNASASANVAGASANDAPERVVQIRRQLSAPRARQARPVVVPAAMQIRVSDAPPSRRLTKKPASLVRALQKQHSGASPMLIHASMTVLERRLTIKPTLLLFLETAQYDVSNHCVWIFEQPSSDVILQDLSDSQNGSRNGTLRILRLTIFTEAGAAHQGIVSNVI